MNLNKFSAIILLLALPFLSSCEGLRATLIGWFSPEYQPEGTVTDLKPEFSGPDSQRKKIDIQLAEMASGYPQITEMVFHPSSDRFLFLAQKNGKLTLLDLKSGKGKEILKLQVPVVSEQGLLGIALHPDFLRNGFVFLNYSVEDGDRRFSRVSRWTMDNPGELNSPSRLRAERFLWRWISPTRITMPAGSILDPTVCSILDGATAAGATTRKSTVRIHLLFWGPCYASM